MKKSYNDEKSLVVKVDIKLGTLGRMIQFYEANIENGNYLDRQNLSLKCCQSLGQKIS